MNLTDHNYRLITLLGKVVSGFYYPHGCNRQINHKPQSRLIYGNINLTNNDTVWGLISCFVLFVGSDLHTYICTYMYLIIKYIRYLEVILPLVLCMCAFVCMCVCVCVCVDMHACMRVCMCAYICPCMFVVCECLKSLFSKTRNMYIEKKVSLWLIDQ